MTQTTEIKRIAIVGPECTGKTDLSIRLARHYQTVWVPEYARYYIDNLHRTYDQTDLLKIAKMQIFTEDEMSLEANNLLICDTNLIVLKVWSDFKYGKCDPEILGMLEGRTYALHFLTGIDVPWENDPQREHPDKREYFYSIYRKELKSLGVDFIEISGDQSTRLLLATTHINKLLK